MCKRFILIFALLAAAWLPASASREPQYLKASLESRLLSQFWKTPVSIEAHVLLPDSYYKEPNRRYPVMYWMQGFGADGEIDRSQELQFQVPMRARHEEFIIVLLDGEFHSMYPEWADSPNFGPWGTALTTEFIPAIDAHYRTMASASSRFAAGHSSGGWSALWLQVAYPDVFGGEWSISPDPVDFRDFTGPDLTRTPPQNFFRDDAGHPYTFEGELLSDSVVEPGWERLQFDSFDWVFGPPDGRGHPKPLFDRKSGAIDPAVAQYWEDHWDISHLLARNWNTLGPLLSHKIHIIVGSADQFGLDRPVHMLQQTLQQLGSDAEFDYVDGADHFTVFRYRGNTVGYILQEAAAMSTSTAANR